MDIVEITPDSFDNEEIILDVTNKNQSVNFGSGIELLMNKSIIKILIVKSILNLI